MFKTRLLSGIMLMIIALTTVIAGGQVLFTVLFAIIFLLSGIMRLFIWKNISREKNIHGLCCFLWRI